MAGNFFRGTSVEQDGRWGKSDEKLMAKMAKNGMFAPILDTKVNLKKVNLDVINKWITQKIIEVVGFEDDILISMVINMLQNAEVDGRKMQLDVTGFLEKQSGAFVAELWTLLVDAQDQPSGIPTVFLQKKKEEILQRQSASNRFGPAQGGAVSAPIAQVRTDGAALTDSNAAQRLSNEDTSRDVKSFGAEGETRKRDRSPSPERRAERRDERRRDHSPERRSRRDSSPERRRRGSPERRDRSPDRRERDRRSPDRRDRDRRDSRSERDDRGRDGRSDRRRDSRDRRDDRRDDRHRDKDRSPERRRDRDSHRDSHRDRRGSPDRRSRSPARRSHRDSSRDRRQRGRSPSPHRKSDRRSRSPHRRSRSPERRKRADSSDHEAARTEAKPSRSASREASADRDLDQSGKWVKSEAVEGSIELQDASGGIVIEE